MTALTANLKHLYQQRMMWFAYVLLLPFFGLCVVSLGKAKFEKNMTEMMLTLMPVFGVIFTSLMTDVLNKPMSFCLPGHQAIVRKLCFIIGIILSVFTACFFIPCPAFDAASSMVMVMTGFFTGLLLYWIGVYLALRYLLAINLIGLWPLMLLLLWVGEPSIILWMEHYCWVLIALGVAGSFAMWVWLARRELHRRICGMPYFGFSGAYNFNKDQKIKRLRARQITKQQTWEVVLEPWILKRISAGSRGVSVLIWRAVYTLIAPSLNYWKQAALAWLLLSIWFCYWGWVSFMVSFSISYGVAMVDLRIYANSVREWDRQQLYVASLVGGMVLLVFALLGIGVLTGVTQCIAPWMPTFDIQGKHMPFVALSWTDLVYPVLLIPAGLLVQLFFYRSRWLILLVVMGAAFGFLGAFAAGGETVLFTEWGWFSLCAACLLLWICFACALRYVCYKFDLIKL